MNMSFETASNQEILVEENAGIFGQLAGPLAFGFWGDIPWPWPFEGVAPWEFTVDLSTCGTCPRD